MRWDIGDGTTDDTDHAECWREVRGENDGDGRSRAGRPRDGMVSVWGVRPLGSLGRLRPLGRSAEIGIIGLRFSVSFEPEEGSGHTPGVFVFGGDEWKSVWRLPAVKPVLSRRGSIQPRGLLFRRRELSSKE